MILCSFLKFKFFALFFVFLIYHVYLNIVSAIKKMTVNKLRDSIYENYHKCVGCNEKNTYC